jgi:hypothetical protein
MKIGLIDNDMIARQTHNFPNLALMKISAFHKQLGDNVSLVNFDIINPSNLFYETFDKVYIAKVFSDTETPKFIDNLQNVKKGGSGFYYDLAEKLPHEIEHTKPDYELYKNDGEYYKNFSIGFITRGCIRQCSFCINKNYKKVEFASDPVEFIDESRPFVMLLDDNITAYKDFDFVFNQLNEIGKPFVFKQGMDFRLLNEKKMQILWNSNYYSTIKGRKRGAPSGRVYHFAFDNIADYGIIEKNLKIYFYTKPFNFNVMFYVLCGFDRNNKYDKEFFDYDFESILKRIELLFKYNAQSYIMIHENVKLSPYKDFIYQLRNIFNNVILYAKGNEEAIIKSKKFELLEFLRKNYPWFLKVKFQEKLFKMLSDYDKKIYSNEYYFDEKFVL